MEDDYNDGKGRREYDAQSTRDIAVIALSRVSQHERLCAARWKMTVTLLWSSISGIAVLLISKALEYFITIGPLIHKG